MTKEQVHKFASERGYVFRAGKLRGDNVLWAAYIKDVSLDPYSRLSMGIVMNGTYTITDQDGCTVETGIIPAE